MTSFKKQIKRINPGRLIQTGLICPHIQQACIKDKCNAFTPHYDINIVSLEEKIAQEKKGYDWEKELEINDWKKHAISRSAIGPDEQDTLYVRQRSDMVVGRCVIK